MTKSPAQRHVAVIVAHPDDETLGAGGTIARHTARGDIVHPVFLTDGVGARGADDDAQLRRADAGRRAAEILGAREPIFLGFPDNQLDTVALLEITQALEKILADTPFDTVYTHHAGDLNIDHALCHRAVLTACRPLPESPVRQIFAMEIASSTEWNSPSGKNAFLPNHFVDIDTTLETKIKALKAYDEEMRPFPHSRSFPAIEANTRLRGASVGLSNAEAFMVIRQIDD